MALLVHSNNLIVGGGFWSAGGLAAPCIAQWDGSNWSTFGTGMSAVGFEFVNALSNFRGDLIAGGEFTAAGGAPANNIARWDGGAWHPLGSGITGGPSDVHSLIEYNGDLVVAGSFTNAGGVPVDNIARWDGSTWHPMGGGLTGMGSGFPRPGAYALAVLDQQLVAGGLFSLASDHVSGFWARYGPSESCTADISPSCGDGSVSINDLLAVLQHWGPCVNCVADIDSDGAISINDLLEILARWGPCP